MEIVSNAFTELKGNEMSQVNGGGITAAVYALGFVMGMTPLGALCVCGACIVGGVAAGVVVSKCS